MSNININTNLFKSWKIVVPITVIILIIGVAMIYFNNNIVSLLGYILILIGLILFFYCMYLYSLK